MPSPVDGSIWGAVMGDPGAVVRVVPGANPPATALAEVYNVPPPGFGARGADIDGNGVVWVSLASGHMGSFDRRKCKGPLNGPKATGDHCPEGWSFHQYPGPGFEGIGENSAESSYYTWVDQHDTFGLGNDVPMSTGNLNDGLIAYANGRMVVLRVPARPTVPSTEERIATGSRELGTRQARPVEPGASRAAGLAPDHRPRPGPRHRAGRPAARRDDGRPAGRT